MNKMGFGFLRLPVTDPKVPDSYDLNLLNRMVDYFLEHGGRYFDTAYTYLNGKSEWALRECLVKRHPRESFLLADKLPGYLMTSHEDCRKYFEEQLERCQVSYFDVYLLHWLNSKNYELAEKYSEFEFLQELKASGRAGKTGFSYHDTADLLDRILTRHPEVDYVQLQVNYLDWESEAIQARRCCQTACKHHKKVIVMEPLKGGTLAQIPENAEKLLHTLDSRFDADRGDLAATKYAAPKCGRNKTADSDFDKHSKNCPENSLPGKLTTSEPSVFVPSTASYGLRFVQSLPEVEIVLSGMNTMEQMIDNMQDVEPVSDAEKAVIWKVADLLRHSTAVTCTACGYCLQHCPQDIPIPSYFKLYNEYSRNPGDDWKIRPAYQELAANYEYASGCVKCRSCEKNCPQNIPVTHYLEKVAEVFE